MEFIILGLLIMQPRSIYEIRTRIDKGMNLMYSCSTGSIQAAIKKLLGKGYIFPDGVSGARQKKTYSITELGKSAFYGWVNSPVEFSAKSPELSKVYFMAFADSAARKNIIEGYISSLQEAYSKLNDICNQGLKISEKDDSDILYFQLQAALYGRDFFKFNIAWYKNLLKSLEARDDRG